MRDKVAATVRGVTLLRALTVAELKETRDFTLMGVLKWMLEPLSFTFVYFVLVASILNRPQRAFPLFLLCALVPWRFFTGAALDGMHVLKRYRDILLNRNFGRQILPLVLLGAEVASLLVALTLFIPLMIIFDAPFGIQLLWLPVLIGILFLVTAGPTYLTSLFGLYFPDFRGAAQNLIRAGYFVSSALVPLNEVPGNKLPLLLQANPFSGVFDSFRAVILYGTAPAAIDVLYPTTVGFVSLMIGLWVYGKRQHEFPKEV